MFTEPRRFATSTPGTSQKKNTPGKFQLFAKSVHLTHHLEGPRKNQLEIQLPKRMLRIPMFSTYLPSRKLT